MSDSGTANCRAILSQENVATLRPLAEEPEHHGDCSTSTAEQTDCRAVSTPRNDGLCGELGPLLEGEPQASEEDASGLCGESGRDGAQRLGLAPTPVSEAPPPSSVEVPSHALWESDLHSQSEGLPEGHVESSPETDSFSDSYSHISPSSDQPPVSHLTTESLGGLELTQEAERPRPEEEEPEQAQSPSDFGKETDDKGAEERAEDGEAEVRRRRTSLLAALEKIGRQGEEEEEEEDVEEEFQLPRRDEDSGFSVNKCILGAVILLGLGTILFSESDYGPRKLRDTEEPITQEWLKPESPQPPAADEGTEILNKLVKETQQIAVLQAQLQAQKEELNAAKGQAAEGIQEQLQQEEMGKENGRLKRELESLLVLQKENERMKRELESVPALQKELETLRTTVMELKLPTASPPPVTVATPPTSGQGGDSRPSAAGASEREAKKPWQGETADRKKEWKKDKHDMGEKNESKKRVKSERKDEARNKMEHEQGSWPDLEKSKELNAGKQREGKREWREQGDWKKEKAHRGDEGKPWKDRGDKDEWKGKEERKDGKEEKEQKKWKSDKLGKDKDWKEKKDGKARKEHRKWEKEEWKGEKEWRKGKDAYRESGKEGKDNWEKKGWKEKGEQKEWRRDAEQRSRSDKEHSREQQGKDERKPWEQKERSKDGESKREGRKEERKDGDWGKDKPVPHKGEGVHKKEEKGWHHHHHRDEPLWQGPGDRKPVYTPRRPSIGQPDYWVYQRERIHQNPIPTRHCDTVDACAQAEGLRPVQLPEFKSILKGYLSKAEEAGADDAITEELGSLATEFFKDGVFAHDQLSFRDYVEDVADILEDMVEGDVSDGEEDSTLEEEMERFEKEAMDAFSLQQASEKKEHKKGKSRSESERGRG